jgi:hypothetical protein
MPGSAHYKSGQVQGLHVDLESKKEDSNTYSTWTLVNPSLVAYIKLGRGAPRHDSTQISHTQDRLDID